MAQQAEAVVRGEGEEARGRVGDVEDVGVGDVEGGCLAEGVHGAVVSRGEDVYTGVE